MPLCINEILWSAGMATLLKYYSTRGISANTGYSISTTVSDLFYVLFTGMATATTVMVGTYLGADELDKARANGYKLIIFSMLMAVVLGVMAASILSGLILPVHGSMSTNTGFMPFHQRAWVVATKL